MDNWEKQLLELSEKIGKTMISVNKALTEFMRTDTFKNLVALINNGAAAYEKSLIELCIYVGEHQGTYNLDQNSLYIGYGAFSYGKVGYDFNAHKMDKGTSKEQATFDEFKTYVMNVMR